MSPWEVIGCRAPLHQGNKVWAHLIDEHWETSDWHEVILRNPEYVYCGYWMGDIAVCAECAVLLGAKW